MSKIGRPKGAKTGSGAHQPIECRVYVEDFDHGPDRVWCVETGQGTGIRYHHAAEVTIAAPMFSIFKGRDAPQPKAFFVGMAVLERRGNAIILHP